MTEFAHPDSTPQTRTSNALVARSFTADAKRAARLASVLGRILEAAPEIDVDEAARLQAGPGDEIALIGSQLARLINRLADERAATEQMIENIKRVDQLVDLKDELVRVFADEQWRAGEPLTIAQTAMLHVQVKPAAIRKWVDNDAVRTFERGGQLYIDPASLNITPEGEDKFAEFHALHRALPIEVRVARKRAVDAYINDINENGRDRSV